MSAVKALCGEEKRDAYSDDAQNRGDGDVEHSLVQEAKSQDYLVAQMAGWEES